MSISNKMLALATAALPANIIRKNLLCTSGALFDYRSCQKVTRKHPCFCRHTICSRGKIQELQTLRALHNSNQKPSSYNRWTRPSFGTVKTQRHMAIGIDRLVRTQTDVLKGSVTHAERTCRTRSKGAFCTKHNSTKSAFLSDLATKTRAKNCGKTTEPSVQWTPIQIYKL
jgi:hypothetical protein